MARKYITMTEAEIDEARRILAEQTAVDIMPPIEIIERLPE